MADLDTMFDEFLPLEISPEKCIYDEDSITFYFLNPEVDGYSVTINRSAFLLDGYEVSNAPLQFLHEWEAKSRKCSLNLGYKLLLLENEKLKLTAINGEDRKIIPRHLYKEIKRWLQMLGGRVHFTESR